MGKRRRVVVDKESLLKKMEYDFSRDAEWFKRTNKKIEEIKEELEKKFYSEDKRKQKVEFMLKLKGKIKDYEDAKKFEERYKKVRFVERRKLERKMKRVKKMLEECNGKDDDEEKKRLMKEEEEIEKDLNYVKFYPKTYKYYSLFPNKDKDKKEMVEKREMMRKKIEFYVNRKMKKKGGNDNDNEGDVVDSDVNVESENEGDNMSDDNEGNNNNDSIEKENNESNMDKSKSNSDDNNKQQKTNKKIIKDKNNKNNNTNNKSNNNNNNNINQTYESHPQHQKKQPFKDPFFELDE
jgi:hypothetical protein